jgi:uncharacterized membrane protein YvlD (DUF360 family)
MKHIWALLIKFVMAAVILETVMYLFSDLTFGSVLWIALVITVGSYIIGDLLILPASNNIVASLADFGIAFAIIYMFNFIWTTVSIPLLSALIAALIVGIAEWFLHKYLASTIK